MGTILHLCCIIVLLVPMLNSQNTAGNSRQQNEQERLRCLGVQCPPERPRCITENQVTKCVASEPIRTISSKDLTNSRLSRPALGFGPSRRRPSQTFQLNEAEKTRSRRNLTAVPLMPSSSVLSKNLDNVPSYCNELFETGRCRAYFPRYYYNKDTERCHLFVYGGCGGNRNNFKTEQACKSACLEPIINSGFNVGLEANYPNPANSGNGNTQQTIPNSNINGEINTRPPHVNSGFAKGAPPPQPGYCQQNPVKGPCLASVPRYYFNKQTGECRSFLYGGCGGNRNNFQTMTSCKRACDYFDFYTSRQSNGKNIPQGSQADILPSDIPSESLNQATESQSQNPSQIPTNNNRLPQGTPSSQMQNYCLQTPERGPCFAALPRYYYNKEVGQCRSFRYGGCGGNGNNFRSMASCKRACGNIDLQTPRQNNGNNLQVQPAEIVLSTDIPEISFNPVPAVPTTTESPVPEYCLLPKKVGPCRALIPRFFYNSETSRCEQFGFGGCQPNDNNFKSERECKRLCIPAKVSETQPITVRRNRNNRERNTMRRGQLRQFNPVDSAAFREFLMSQKMNNDIDFVGPSVSGFHVCAQRMDPGTCNLEIRSYYFSASTRTCQPFIYHGCGGNRNRFSSLRACQDMCMNDSLRPARTP